MARDEGQEGAKAQVALRTDFVPRVMEDSGRPSFGPVVGRVGPAGPKEDVVSAIGERGEKRLVSGEARARNGIKGERGHVHVFAIAE